MRIGSDVQFQSTPAGGIDEVHLWSVGRTQAQVRLDMSAPITAALPGLVSVWHFNGTTADSIGGHNGTVSGSGVGGGSFATAALCSASLSLSALRFTRRVPAAWRYLFGSLSTAPRLHAATASGRR